VLLSRGIQEEEVESETDYLEDQIEAENDPKRKKDLQDRLLELLRKAASS